MASASAAEESAAVWILHDESEREPSQRLAAEAGLQALQLGTGNPEAFGRPGISVVNINLAAMDSVQRLRRMLAKTKHQLVFAVDGGARSHVSRMQANALGASKLIARPLCAEQLRAVLADLGVAVEPRKPAETAEVPRSIKAAASALDTAFRSIVDGLPLDMPQVVDAGHVLLEDVAQTGASQWLDLVRAHHEGTFQHCLLVTGAAVVYGQEAKLPELGRLTLTIAALLHDIGKAKIPLEILDKPGKLTAEEYALVKRHPADARDYLKTLKLLPRDVIEAVGQHHELLDGSGYPDGLRGDQIGPLTRILTVCDIYGALLERRSYKEPKSPAEAAIILADMAGFGKVEYDIVRTLARALQVDLPEGHFRIA